MATSSRLTIYRGGDRSVRVDVTTEDGGTTPQTMTGWALMFVLRRSNGALVLSKTTGGGGITIGNGSGTDDRATIAIARADTLNQSPGKDYVWALWRTDDGSDTPLAYGPCLIVAVAEQA